MPTFRANPKQTVCLTSRARFVGYIGGIGSGKTATGAVKSILNINEGKSGIVVAPDFPHFAKSTWPEWSKWIPWMQVKNASLNHPYTQDKRLIFDTPHGDVDVYYGGIDEPSSWTGPTVNWFWFDEAARKDKRDAFHVLIGRIREGKDPQGIVTTTPKGRMHWLYDIFVRQNFPKEIKDIFAQSGRLIAEYVQALTEDNRVNLDPLYVASLRALYTGRYALQELEGQFITFEGVVFESFNEKSVTELAEYIPGIPVQYGVDDGFTKGHPRVFLLAQEVPPFINVFDEYVSLYELPEVSLECLRAKPYSMADVAYIDSSAAELASRLWDTGVDTVRSTHKVEEGIKHTRPFICDGAGVRRVRFHPRCEFSIEEIQAYSYPERERVRDGSGQPKPKKKADNAADALRYLLWNKNLFELDEAAVIHGN